jgi:hypothetical protein
VIQERRDTDGARGAIVIQAPVAEKATKSRIVATLGHGEDASSMQRVPPDLHPGADGGHATEGLRRDVSRCP